MGATFDVAVLGAGVAGLLVAGELAQRHSVILLEKASRLPRSKYWLTDTGSGDASPHLAPAIDSTYRDIDFIAYDETTFRCRGSYYLWDTDRLLTILQQRFESRGGELRCGVTFYSYRRERDGVFVLANDQKIRARLVVDCMGAASPIVYAEDVLRVDGYYLLHGATFPRAADFTPVAFHNLMLSDHPGYVEAFPTSDGRVHIVLISAAEKLTSATTLAADFTFICTKSPYARLIESPTAPSRRFLGGVVPVGRMRRQALDRIVFFGEAGQANPPASATALTRMLYAYEATSRAIAGCIEHNTLDAASLSRAVPPLVDRFNQAVQRALFRRMLHWRSRHFRAVLEELNRLDDHRFANDMIFATIQPRDIGSYARRLLSARATTLLTTLGAGILPRFT